MRKRLWGPVKPPLGVHVMPGHPMGIGLVGVWLFNEMAGLHTRDALGRWPGALTGTGWSWDVVSPSPRVLRNSGAAGTYVDCGPIPLDSNNWTIASRLRPTFSGASANRCVAWGGAGPTLYRAGTNDFLAIVHSGTVDLTSSEPLALGEWVSAAITRAGSRARCYKNGKTVASSDAFSVSYTNDTQFRIGNSSSFGEPFPGVYDYVMAWNRGLTDSEIQALHDQPFVALAAPRAWIGIHGAATQSQAPRSLDQFRRRRVA